MKTLGIIGLGSIGSRHARNLKAMGHRTAGFDPDESKSGVCDVFFCETVDALLELKLDGIIIASPTRDHVEHIHKSYNLDSIGVFVEKPIADKMDADIDYVDMVGYNLRFHSCVKKAKEWIDAAMIGEPLWANFTVAQYSNKPDYLRDGVILNWSHEIDLALHLIGPAQVRSCAAINKESLADIVLSHTNGCQSAIHLDYITQPEIRQSLIVGTDAMIIMDLVRRQAWLRGADGTIWDQFEGQDSWDENYVEEIEAFIDRLDGEETLGCTGEEGLEVLRICLDAKKLSQ